MATPKTKRRRLQFTLLSLLALLLAVGLWLNYELWQARIVERQTAAIEALGGQVTYEPAGFSLLGLVLDGAYGKQVVEVDIPGHAVSRAIDPLVALPYLRSVRISEAILYRKMTQEDFLRLEEALSGRQIEFVFATYYPAGGARPPAHLVPPELKRE